MQYIFQPQVVVQSRKYQDEAKTFVILGQPHEISSPVTMTSGRRDIIGGIQSRFVYQSTFPNYYESMKNWEVEENTNIDVFEEIEENYLRSSEYAEA